MRARIDSGELRPGDALLSINQLAEDACVGRTTVAKALRLLIAEGYAPGCGDGRRWSPGASDGAARTPRK